MPSQVILLVFHLVADVKYRISVERGHCFLMVPLTMPSAVALSYLMGFGVCGLPSSDNFSRMVRPPFTFMNISPNSDSAADDATIFKMVHSVNISPFNVMGYPSLWTELRKKWPDALLLMFFE